MHPRTKFGLLAPTKNNIITAFKEKPVLSDWVSGGYMVFNQKIFKYIRKNEMDIPALKRLIKINQLSMYKHEEFWFAVDTYKELEDLNKIWDSGKAPWKIWD